jgi:transposase
MNKSLINAVCIDDFALKKRVSYGTIMVDIETGRVADLLESRDMEDVTNWLRTFPNVQVVSRDGSQAYASAISKAFPDAIQISDRFHILKNLSETVTLYFYKIFKGRVSIPITPATLAVKRTILDSPSMRDRVLLAKKLYKDGKSQSEIKCITNFSSNTIKKYISIKEEDIPESKKTVRERQHIESIQKVVEKINWVRKLKAEGYSIYNISKTTGFVPNTIKKYRLFAISCG